MAGLLGSLIEKFSGSQDESSSAIEENELPAPKDVQAMLEYQAEQIRAGNIPQGKAFQDAEVDVEEISFDENRIELTAEEMQAIMGTSEDKTEVSTESVENEVVTNEEIVSESPDGIDLNERVEISPEQMEEILNPTEKDSSASVETAETVEEHGQVDPDIEVADISIEEYEAAVAAQQAREAEADVETQVEEKSENIDKDEVATSVEEEKPELSAEQMERIEKMEQHRDSRVEAGEIDEKADFVNGPADGIDLEVVNVSGTEVEAINFNEEIEDIKRVIEDVTQQMEDQKDVDAANDPDIAAAQETKRSSGASR